MSKLKKREDQDRNQLIVDHSTSNKTDHEISEERSTDKLIICQSCFIIFYSLLFTFDSQPYLASN